MSQKKYFNNVNDLDTGIKRELAEGVSTRDNIACSPQKILVDIEPNAKGKIHSHPEEQWGFLIEGSGVRIQGGEEIAIKKGDFWQTPGGVEHGIIAGPEGAKILDVFSPPREQYKSAGSGFGS